MNLGAGCLTPHEEQCFSRRECLAAVDAPRVSQFSKHGCS